MEGIHDRGRAWEGLAGGGLVSGEPVHRHYLDAVLPCLGVGLEPGLERCFGAAGDHVQQPRRAGLVPGWGEVDDHGDVLVAAPGVAPEVLVNTDHADGVEAGWVIDQQLLALGQDGVVGGVPGNPEPGGDPCDREVIDDQGFQCPPHPAAGEFRPLGRGGGGVLSPAVAAVTTPVAPDPHQQGRGEVAERLVSEATSDRAARGRPRPAGAAPRIFLRESTLEHRPLGREALTDGDQTEFVQAREGRQIGAVEGSVGHVEVFLMASVRTSIIGRPRRLSRHRRAHPTLRSYTLICEEPEIGPDVDLRSREWGRSWLGRGSSSSSSLLPRSLSLGGRGRPRMCRPLPPMHAG